MKRIGFFDTETTGLLKPCCVPLKTQPRCIEICLLIYEERKIVKQYETMVNPGIPISSVITRITGITDQDVKEKPSWRSISRTIADLIITCDCMVAHNFTFDRDILDYEMKRIGQEVRWPIKQICTVEATEHIKGHRLKLANLYEICTGSPMGKTHRAEADVEAVAKIFFHLQDKGMI